MLVVGVAIIDQGRLLATRRVLPAELAGGWEFPGGKVDPGETSEQSAVREVAEELGCAVQVTGRLGGEQQLRAGVVLHVYAARLVGGEPTPRVHDALRWLGPEELDEVAWLSADRPFLGELEQLLLDGESLPGGNVGGAVRIGATARRPTGPWTPAVHALLDHLATAGLDGVPRVLGIDARGREVLTYLPGRTCPDGEAPDHVIVEAMHWLRRYHAAVRDFRPTGSVRWRFSDRSMDRDEIICHHDVAPYNVVVDESQRLVGVIDWDVAGPGHPLDDLAFSAWNFVPLWRDVGVRESARRLRLLCASYGAIRPSDVLAGVVPRISGAVANITAGQAAGDSGMANLAAVGEPGRTRVALDHLIAVLPGIEQELGRGTP